MPGAWLAVLAFTSWTVLLALGNALYRAALVLSARRAAHAFGTPDDGPPDFTWRLTRAHMNCVENLPIFFALVWLCDRARADMSLVTLTALLILGARVGQTTAHLISGRGRFVHVRFTFFLMQVLGYVALIAFAIDAV